MATAKLALTIALPYHRRLNASKGAFDANDSSISVTPRLAISIRTPQGEAIVQLTRLSAQVLASTLRAYSGLPSKGIDLNAGNFRTVHGEAVPTPKNALPVVRLHPVKSSALRSAPGSSTMERARATLTIKAVAEADGRRTFSGVASTPVVDRQGDIVVPEGAEFTLPLALLWAHDTKQPIGWVRRAVAMTAGILVEGEVAQIAEAGRLKDRLDEAWGMMKAGLVRGLSIGFRALKTVPIASGLRIERWSWLELSAVTIPANEGAGITAIKHAGYGSYWRRGRRPVLRGTPGESQSGTGTGQRSQAGQHGDSSRAD